MAVLYNNLPKPVIDILGWIIGFFNACVVWPNCQVSHRSQPPMALDLSLTRPAGSGWLNHLGAPDMGG